MAVPAFVSYTGHGDTNPTTSNSITCPTTANNDILILQMINGGANAAPTGPGGTYAGGAWTALDSGGWTSGWGGVWWSRCTGNHSGGTITFSAATDSISSGVGRYSGCVTSGNPYDTNIATSTVAAGANCALSAFTTIRPDGLVIYCVSVDDNIVMSSPTMNSVAMGNLSQKASSGGADSEVGQASLRMAQPGSTGSFSMTFTAGTNQGKRATAFSLIPPDGVIPDLQMSPPNPGGRRRGA